MNARRDPDHLIHTFLLEGDDELQDQVYDAVRERIEQTRQRAVIGSWRTPDVNPYLKIGLAAAAMVVVAVVGYQLLAGTNIGGPGLAESPEPTSTPVVTPEPTPETTAAGLPLGPHTLTETGAFFDVAMTVTIAAEDWDGVAGEGIVVKNDNPDAPDGAGLIVFTGEIEVYGDACNWQTTQPDPITGPTVDDAIAALAAQVGRDATEPVDITLDGFTGKSIQLSVPTDIDFAACDGGQFRSWGPTGYERYHQDPGQIDQVWVVDVNGIRVVIDQGYYAGTPEAARAEMQAIVDSITFEQTP